MKLLRLLLIPLLSSAPLLAADAGGRDYVETYDTTYNSLTIEKRGNIVEMRARARGTEALESAVDLTDPLKPVVAYTKTLYAGLFFQPKPSRVLMVGLGGAGIHRLFTAAFPESFVQTVELDPKVYELSQSHMAFKPTANTPVALMDGRVFVKRDRQKWDWLILDAFCGGYVPPHLKSEEFYKECAERLADDGVFITNLHATTNLYYSDIKTLQKVFPQVVLFQVAGRGNVLAYAVKYASPSISDPSKWPANATLMRPPLEGRVDLDAVRKEFIPPTAMPAAQVRAAKVITDDFAPVEFLNAAKNNNTR